MNTNTTPREPAKRRNEKEGIFNFTREMVSALLMAFIAIVYVIQAFKIPTGSMENSLLVGDFLLGLKFIYGAPVLPFSYKKFPGIVSPKQGDVVIFKYPGADKKDYIKRCVAGPGQTVEIKKQTLIVDGVALQLPPEGKYERKGALDPYVTDFNKLRIPAKGDTLYPARSSLREFLFLKHLIHQENPRKKITATYELFIDGEPAGNQPVVRYPSAFGVRTHAFNQIDFEKIDNWVFIQTVYDQLRHDLDGHEVEIRRQVFLDGAPVHQYVARHDNYFMLGDNRDNSMDSRYWGYVNRNFVKAKAFILYFSLDKDTPYLLLPLKIRWNRIGKLIRGWDGLE